MSDAIRSVRRASRILVRSPGLSLLAVLAFGLGIGLTTVMFSIVHGALLRGLPLPEPEELVAVVRTNPSEGINQMGASLHDFADWREAQRTMEGLAGYYTGTVNLADGDRPERLDGGFFSAGTMELLGIRPLLGRTHRVEEDRPGAPLTLLLGHHVWRDRYGSDPGILGRSLRVNGESAEVIGVMPEGFRFPQDQDVWLPLRADPLSIPRGEGMFVSVLGRMRPGVDLDAVQLEMTQVARRLEEEHPESNQGIQVRVRPVVESFIGDEARALLLTMLVAVSFVLLIACFNVANLLLARAAARSREVAIRTALGAGRRVIIAQQLLEALVLACAGGVLGLGIAAVGLRIFTNAIADTDPPYWLVFDLNPTVLLFTLGMAASAAVLAGLIPALQASGARVHDLLKDESRGGTSRRLSRLTRGLVIGEVALSVALLAAAGLMIRSIVNVGNLELGFPPEEVLTARVGLFETDFPGVEDRTLFWEAFEERVRGLPGGAPVTLTSSLPATGSMNVPLALQGARYDTDRDVPRARRIIVTPGFDVVFGMPVLEGRALGTEDRAGGLPVATVSRGLAERFFPGESPVGKQIRLAPPSADEAAAPWLTVVGVVGDIFHTPDDEIPWTVYTPLAQSDARFMSVAVRTRGEPMALAPAIRDAAVATHADTPIYFVRDMTEVIRQQTWFYSVFGGLFLVFGLAALFLASVGLYGVLAFSVGRRTPELGIRMALGARSADVRRLVLGQGLFQMGVGVALGLGMALVLGQALGNFLFRVEPRDPLVLLGTALVLFLTGLAASAVPVRRATRVDPMVAFRSE
jgi:putative ABC transport system permease protein